jgi:hypothetical protein
MGSLLAAWSVLFSVAACNESGVGSQARNLQAFEAFAYLHAAKGMTLVAQLIGATIVLNLSTSLEFVDERRAERTRVRARSWAP